VQRAQSYSSAARFNPIDDIRKGTFYEGKDAMHLALFLVEPLGQGLETARQRRQLAACAMINRLPNEVRA
jgi:hypothetical protein